MGARKIGNGIGQVYEVAKEWVARALKYDDSLFTPGEPIWTRENLADLRERFLDSPDESNQGFYSKLTGQLAGCWAEVRQLMGEALFVHYLSVWGMTGGTKKDRINQALSESVVIPPKLGDALQPGFIRIGAGNARLDSQLATLLEFVEQWKENEQDEQQILIDDPWKFKSFLFNMLGKSRTLLNKDSSGWIEREILLHIVHPDTFEGSGTNDKNAISGADAFADFVEPGISDVDRKLERIRQRIEAELGRDFDFYDSDIRTLWDDRYRLGPWDDFVRRAKQYVGSGRLESDETEYKLAIAGRIETAKNAVFVSSDDWTTLVKRGLGGNLINGIQQARFRDWIDESPEDVVGALQAIWADNDSSLTERIQEFCQLMPKSAASGVGTRMNVISVLLMGLSPELYPPFRTTKFNHAYALTGYGKPEPEADEATLYEHALDFLDNFIAEALARGLKICHRLDAQGIVWGVLSYYDEMDEEEDDEFAPVLDFSALAEELFLPTEFLEEIHALLEDKKQVIFQGPPGTGKTYVAQAVAEHLAGSKDRVTLVQFHPSYDYVDFVHGYRPALMENGQPGFRLQDGPLLRAAKQAEAERDVKHFLIIDEINRGNLAKVFGELYFLLEYRDSEINLQYSDKPFRLPPNLYIIGTMNTADRSIALVDLALRRRFYFVEFHPSDKEIGSVLRKYLAKNAPGMGWVAEVVDKANEQLQQDERGAAIGPSYFMKENLNEGDVEVRWKHSVMPYIRELLFGQESRIADFELDKLRGLIDPDDGNEAGLESGSPSNGDADGIPDA